MLWWKRHGKNTRGVFFPSTRHVSVVRYRAHARCGGRDTGRSTGAHSSAHTGAREDENSLAVNVERDAPSSRYSLTRLIFQIRRTDSFRVYARRSLPRWIASTAQHPGRERPPSLPRSLVPSPSRRVAHVPDASPRSHRKAPPNVRSHPSRSAAIVCSDQGQFGGETDSRSSGQARVRESQSVRRKPVAICA